MTRATSLFSLPFSVFITGCAVDASDHLGEADIEHRPETIVKMKREVWHPVEAPSWTLSNGQTESPNVCAFQHQRSSPIEITGGGVNRDRSNALATRVGHERGFETVKFSGYPDTY